jgi:hypothetical protein
MGPVSGSSVFRDVLEKDRETQNMVRAALYVRRVVHVLFSIMSSQDPFFAVSLNSSMSFSLPRAQH